MIKGIKRFRQAIKNQRDVGEGEFHLSFVDVEAICKECEDELARLSWAHGVPAPVDADGEVVPLTTKVMYDDDGGEMTIMSFTFYVDGGFWRTDPECPSVYAIDRVDLLHLHRPDSWKRLEEDVKRCKTEDTACAYYDRGASSCDGCPGRVIGDCSYTVAADVLRRAKALAERDAKASTPQSSPHEAKGDE